MNGTIMLYVLVLAVVACVPMLADIVLAYRSRNKTRDILIEKAGADKLDLKELREFMKEIGSAPPGISGLARSTMAITVIVVLGIAVIHILVDGAGQDTGIVENILSMLAGLLAAITGFYFGGKPSEKASAQGQPAAKPPSGS